MIGDVVVSRRKCVLEIGLVDWLVLIRRRIECEAATVLSIFLLRYIQAFQFTLLLRKSLILL